MTSIPQEINASPRSTGIDLAHPSASVAMGSGHEAHEERVAVHEHCKVKVLACNAHDLIILP